MKTRRTLIMVCLIMSLGIFLISCRSNNVSLDFLIIPDQLIVYSNGQLKKLNEIEDRERAVIKSRNDKYEDLSKMSEKDMKIQEEIHNEVIDALNSGKIIEDKTTIEDIFTQLRVLKGRYISSFEENIILRIDLIEDPQTESVVSLDNDYLRSFIILEEGNMIIPKAIVSNSKTGLKPTSQIKYIKVKLPEELRSEMEGLAKN